jgi:3-methyl-2-oxobutanoate hydroxymethyltransferase
MLIDDAKRLEDAGAFSIVLECIPAVLAARITEAVSVPTIGIGAGEHCDGQILVYHDMLGIYPDSRPKHVKVFVDAGALMRQGIKNYVDEVKESTFPTKEHSF